MATDESKRPNRSDYSHGKTGNYWVWEFCDGNSVELYENVFSVEDANGEIVAYCFDLEVARKIARAFSAAED